MTGKRAILAKRKGEVLNAPIPKPARPKRERPARRLIDTMPVVDDDNEDFDWDRFYKPCTVTFLCNVLQMDARTVKRRLAECPPIGRSVGKQPLYNFHQTLPFLIDPKGGALHAIKNLKPKDLPLQMQESYWSAKMKQIKYEEAAGDLWPTVKVLEVVGEAFKRIKTETRLWTTTLMRESGLTVEQRKTLDQHINGLLGQLSSTLTEMHEQSSTGPVLDRPEEEEPDMAFDYKKLSDEEDWDDV